MRLTDEQIERIEKMWSVPKSHEIPRLIADLRAYKTALEEIEGTICCINSYELRQLARAALGKK